MQCKWKEIRLERIIISQEMISIRRSIISIPITKAVLFIYLFFRRTKILVFRSKNQKWSFPALVRGLNDKSIRRIHVMQCEFLMAAVDCPRRHHINEPVFLGNGYRLIEREKASKGSPRNEKNNGESGA